MAYREPALFTRLLEVLAEATVGYLSAQVEAGAEALMLFDSWAGVLSPAQFRSWVIGPTRQIVARIRRRHPAVPVIGFPRLAGTMIGEYADTGVNAIGLDTSMNLSVAATLLPGRVAMQGNLDPLALVAGGGALTTEVQGILTAARHRPFVFNLGHGIVPQTPPENVTVLKDLVRAG
jgi:uroporphyrinogen decarboxylase